MVLGCHGVYHGKKKRKKQTPKATIVHEYVFFSLQSFGDCMYSTDIYCSTKKESDVKAETEGEATRKV